MALRLSGSVTALVIGTAVAATAGLGASAERPSSLELAAARRIHNREAVVPPQCYTRTFGAFNPCYTCHQTYADPERLNFMWDRPLQAAYDFSDIGFVNHWSNLFVDRSDAVAAVGDDEILDYVETDNYSDLRERLEARAWQGWLPDLANLHLGADAFDADGFAKDGSGWVTFNYKPFPSTFWPTNGSTDDVMIRLPEAFRATLDGVPSKAVYRANLAILELAIKDLGEVSVLPIDETEVARDLDGDGTLGIASRVLPQATYVGSAEDVAVHPMLYPEGTSFLHSVRYIGVEGDQIRPATRMKELRYMTKIRFYDPAQLRTLYGNERQEKIDGKLPQAVNAGDRGLDGGMGWLISGFIEDAQGALRPQTYEETSFCMGCHGTIGATIDQTFAFPRKPDGAEGWGYIDLHGMPDVPSAGEEEGEILTYLRRVGGGNEFRENPEMQARWFDGETVLADAVEAADVYTLITPSPERALALNKAHRAIVREQSFIYGRDGTIAPATNVYHEIDPETAPVLPRNRQFSFDIRLDWQHPRSLEARVGDDQPDPGSARPR